MEQACQAEPPPVRDARRRCLERNLAALERLLVGLETADRPAVDAAVSALLDLPDVGRCSDPRALAGGFDPAPTVELDARMQEIRTRLDTVDAALALDHDEEAWTEIEQLDEASDGHGDLVGAEVAVRVARVLERRGELQRARAAFERALWLAVASGHGLVEFESALGVARLEARVGDAWQHAGAVAKRLGMAPEIESTLLSARAADLAARGEFESAIAARERVVELVETSHGPEHLGVVEPLLALASTHAMADETARAREIHGRVVALVRERLDPTHPLIARAHITLATSLPEDTQAEDAAAFLAQAIELLPQRPPEPRARALLALAGLRGRHERFDAALAAYHQALDVATPATTSTQRDLQTQARLGAGLTLGRLDRWDEALEQFVAARHALEDRGKGDDPRLPDVLDAQAQALEALERYDEALEVRSRAVELLGEPSIGTDHRVADALVALSEVHSRLGDPAAALLSSRKALTLAVGAGDEASATTLTALLQIGRAALAIERPLDAAAAFERAADLARAAHLPAMAASARLGHASALWSSGAKADAIAIVRELEQQSARTSNGSALSLDDIHAWLARRDLQP